LKINLAAMLAARTFGVNMTHRYLIQWDNQSYLRFDSPKYLSMAELQFLIWMNFQNDPQMPMPKELADAAMQGYSIVMIGIDRQYWNERR
jgi:hypothetical protein